MTRRCPLLRTVGLTWIVLIGSLVGGVVHAQDRGAPRFGATVNGDTVGAKGEFAGRLWSVAAPPFDRFEQRYGVSADSAWATHLRRGLLRLPHCTAALVSPKGLALTTAECVRNHLDPDGEAPVVAGRAGEERELGGLYVERLVRATDVTAEVSAAQQDTAARRAVAAVQQRLDAAAGPNRRVRVESVAGGDAYTAFTYRRYEEVRLVFLPDERVSAFGGTEAAMTYPRQALDAAFLRVYTAAGTPLEPEHYFQPSAQGVRPGDPVFAIGASRRTRRAESADQLALRRDLILPDRRAVLTTWVDAVQAYLDTAATTPQWRPAVQDGAVARKRTNARLEALQTESVMQRIQGRDDALRRSLQQDPRLRRRYGGLLDSLAAIQAEKRSLAPAYRAFGTFGVDSYTSTTFRRLLRALEVGTGPNAASADAARSLPVAGPSRAPAVETALFADRIRRLTSFLRPDTAAVDRLLGGQSPTELAASIVHNSVLASPTYTADGRLIVPPSDPAATLVDVVKDPARSFIDEWERLLRREQSLTRRLERARQAVREGALQPGGPGTPRLTDGRILGYPYNGTTAPPFTTFYGLYGQSHAFGGGGAWALPERWRRASSRLNRSQPLTLAATTDPVAASPGAPLLNKYLEIVGVALGTNIQGVAGEYLFLPERMRTVAVDLRGLRESLREVYEAEAIVKELFAGPSEASSPRR